MTRGILKAKYWAERVVQNQPALWLLWFTLYRSRRGVPVTRPSRSASLHLDGYPRSGNTFLTNLIRHAFPALRSNELVHHLHSISALRLSERYGTPIFILVRYPRDAIVSNYIKHFSLRGVDVPDDCDTELLLHQTRRYKDFYSFVCRRKTLFRIVEFSKMVSDPLDSLTKLCKELEFDVRAIGSDTVAQFEAEFERRESRKDPLGGSLPNSHRQTLAGTLAPLLDNLPEYSECERLYAELTQ